MSPQTAANLCFTGCQSLPAFETWILHELLCHRDHAKGAPVTHWKSRNNFELDFILGDHTAVEVKGRADVSERDVRGLFAVAEEKAFKRLVCVSLSPRPQRAGRIEILPWADFLDALWEGEFTG